MTGEIYSYALNEWFDDLTPDQLRDRKFAHSLVVAQSMKDDDGRKRPVFVIWADDGQRPEDTMTFGFTIKTLSDFNRVFGTPGSVKESFTLRWSKLAGLIRS